MASAALSRRVEFRSEPFPAPTRASPSLIVLLMIVAGLAYVPVGFGIALIRQRGSRRRLTISGLRSTTFWTARLGLDLCLYLIPGILIIGAAVLARTLPLPSPSAIVILIVGLGVNGAVVLAFNGWVTSRIESLPAYSAWASILYLFESMALLVVSELDLGLIPDLLLTPWPNFVLSRTLVAIGTGTDAGLFALLPIYAMAVSAALFWFLLILRSDRRPDPSPIRRRSGPPPPISPTRPPDPDVAQEANEIVAHYADTNRYQVCLDRIQVGEDSYRIVRGVSFGIGRGQVLGLLGPNGAGKSTLARCMVGSIRPEGGRGRLLNLDLAQDRDQISQVMGYVPQEDDDLLPSLSASQHLHLFAHIKGVPQAEVDGVCKRLIRQLDLGSCADRPTRTYSGGTRRKLSLGLALLGNVPVLVLDEPTNGLDAHARRLAWDLIASWTPGAGTLLVTHDTREAERLGDRIAIMCDGRLQCLGTATHLKGRYASSYQVDLTLMDDGAGHVQAVLDALEEQGVSEPVQVRTRAGARARLQTGNLDRVHVPVLFAVLAGLQAQGRIRDFAVAQCSLDDVLLGFVER